jgi:hypothetical protein
MQCFSYRKWPSKGIDRIRVMLHRFVRTFCFGFILVLPFGIYRGNPDSTSASISGNIGTGQYASVIRDCNGPVAAQKSTFTDYALSAHLAIPPRQNSPFVLGVSWGEWHSKSYRFPIYQSNINDGYSYVPSQPQSLKFNYFNPSISLETRPAGIGFGFISGRRPLDLSPDDYKTAIDGSFHFRFGNPRSFYFITSYNENTPLVSGGGYYDVGVVSTNRKLASFYFGFSGGLYDSPGFLYQMQLPLQKHLSVSAALRYGAVHGVAELGFAAGLKGSF